MLSRNDILGADDLPRTEVEIPEWGGSVYVRAMTIREAELLDRLDDVVEQGMYLAHVAGLCTVDANGEQLFTSDDVPALAEKSARAVKRLAEAAIRFNALTDEALAEAKNG